MPADNPPLITVRNCMERSGAADETSNTCLDTTSIGTPAGEKFFSVPVSNASQSSNLGAISVSNTGDSVSTKSSKSLPAITMNDDLSLIPSTSDSMTTYLHSSLPIDVDRLDDRKLAKHNSRYWISDLHLFEDDKRVLKSSYEWLNDNIINAAQSLLKHQTNNEVKGWQDTQKGKKCSFVPIHSEPFIQILNVGGDHWITVTNLYCKNRNAVELYDSAYSGLSLHTKKQICSIVKLGYEFNDIEFKIMDVQRQKDTSSCGLFATAFATEFCLSNNNPSFCEYDTSVMRQHHIKCLESKQLTPFPKLDHVRSPRVPYKVLIKEKLYCYCRSPLDMKKLVTSCIKFKKWFHNDCISNVSNFLENWVCSICQ